MKVFVTGHQGYIGTCLVEVLKQAGHWVTGCDLGLFRECGWASHFTPDAELVKDIRDLTSADLAGHDCVMHLAALSNDPLGELDPALTSSINLDGSVHVARVAKAAGVPRFLFSGSCSVYGQGAHLDLDESAPLHPLTAYARSKIEAEEALRHLADEHFCPVFLRNATAYGYSPRLRIDLVANHLLTCALAVGQIQIKSDGTPWRPLVHCRDIARAFVTLMEASRAVVWNQAVNIGANDENYQVRDVADAVQRRVPAAGITYTGEIGPDPRNYRVKCDRLYHLRPDFCLAYNLRSGLEDLHRKLLKHGFSPADFHGDRFVRLRWLKQRLNRLRQADAVARPVDLDQSPSAAPAHLSA